LVDILKRIVIETIVDKLIRPQGFVREQWRPQMVSIVDIYPIHVPGCSGWDLIFVVLAYSESAGSMTRHLRVLTASRMAATSATSAAVLATWAIGVEDRSASA
jgi:hypothetical protein